SLDPAAVTRVIVCSGKVYYDLVNARKEAGRNDVAIIRVEQLYPFAHKSFQAEFSKYPNAKEVVWTQDEPQNQGPWFYIQHHLYENMSDGQKLGYAGRAASASPAVGSLAKHIEQQRALLEAALAPKFKGFMLTKYRTTFQKIQKRIPTMAITDVLVPQLSESISEATLLNWKKQPGEAVEVDEILIEVETDKVVLEVPAPSAGVLKEIVKGDGATVTSGEVLARIDTEGKASAAAAPAAAEAPAEAPAAAAPAASAASASAIASPAANKILSEKGVDPASVEGTGRGGRITKGDALS